MISIILNMLGFISLALLVMIVFIGLSVRQVMFKGGKCEN